MKLKFRLVLLSLVAVFAFHWRAFLPATMKHFQDFHDMPDIYAGYNAVPNFWVGTLRWFTGPWINTGAGGYRPLSSMLHYAQVTALDAGYLHYITVTTLLMFTAICALVGALVSRWSGERTGLLAGVLCALVPASWGVPGVDQFGWFVVTDNLLCLLGLLCALFAFDHWQTSGSRRHALLALGFLLAGCLSKEYAYIGPFMLAAVHFRRPHPDAPTRPIWPVLSAFIMVAALFLYRRSILYTSDHGSPAMMTQSNWWLHSGFTSTYWRSGIIDGLILMIDQWLQVMMSSLILIPFVIALRFATQLRRHTPVGAGELLLFLSFVPIAGFGLLNHRLLFPWTFASIAFTPAIWQWLHRIYMANLAPKGKVGVGAGENAGS